MPTTSDVLVFAEAPDLSRAEAAVAMLRTISVRRLHDMFPAWRRMAEAVRIAREDEAVMAELRIRVEREGSREPGALRFP